MIEGNDIGSVILVTASDVTLGGLEIRGSCSNGIHADAGIELDHGADRALVEGNRRIGNLVGIHP